MAPINHTQWRLQAIRGPTIEPKHNQSLVAYILANIYESMYVASRQVLPPGFWPTAADNKSVNPLGVCAKLTRNHDIREHNPHLYGITHLHTNSREGSGKGRLPS